MPGHRNLVWASHIGVHIGGGIEGLKAHVAGGRRGWWGKPVYMHGDGGVRIGCAGECAASSVRQGGCMEWAA